MRMLAIVTSLAALATFFSCEKDNDGTTPNGFEYFVFNHDENAPKVKVDDYVTYHLYAFYDDSLQYTTATQGQPLASVIPDVSDVKEEDYLFGMPNPIIDVITVLSKGDSAIVVVPLDSILISMNPGLKEVKRLTYGVKVLMIEDGTKIKAQQEAEKKQHLETMRTAGGEVTTLVDDLIKKHKDGDLGDALKKTSSGLEYYVVQAGTGPKPQVKQALTIHYYGALADGKVFDTSFASIEPSKLEIGTGSVIKGFDEGLMLFNVGTKVVLFIPNELGYGAGGSPGMIPPNTDLVFYVEIINAE